MICLISGKPSQILKTCPRDSRPLIPRCFNPRTSCCGIERPAQPVFFERILVRSIKNVWSMNRHYSPNGPWWLFLDCMGIFLRFGRSRLLYGNGTWVCCRLTIAYALEITGIDPVEKNLLFKRFLNAGALYHADIDMIFLISIVQNLSVMWETVMEHMRLRSWLFNL